jgi:ethanolamine utilization protein EutN
MIYGKVVGHLWSTIEEKEFVGKKLLIIEPIDLAAGKLTGETIVAVDTVDAGIGEIVLVVYEGGSARMVLNDEKTSVEAVVVGVVDHVKVEAAI